jgi:hypothetical protein
MLSSERDMGLLLSLSIVEEDDYISIPEKFNYEVRENFQRN